MNRFETELGRHGISLRRGNFRVLQINVGRKCNQTCTHCHVDAGPHRTEMMDETTAARVREWITRHRPAVVDITGGAPELSAHFRDFVITARSAGAHVIDRNNLTIIETASHAWLPGFLAEHQVEVVASLPCYLEENVDGQRGDGVFAKSLRALRKLNAAGYGTRLPLTLVYNPTGPSLPPDQRELEDDYRRELKARHDIVFTRLIAITNQPIARFADELRARGEWDAYLKLLANHFNPATIAGLMCRDTLSVGWGGELYDCDFNQMLGMRLREGGKPLMLWDIEPRSLVDRGILTGDHCLACTAGSGSSCGGAVVASAAA
jgi:radical SAM/Cys-rich protein